MLICFPTGEPLDEFSFLLGRLFEVEVWSHMVAWFNLNFWNDLSICKMKLNSGTRAVSTLQPGGTGRHLICSHAGCFHPRDPRQSHTAHCPWKIASLPWVPKDSGAQSTQTRSAWPSRCVISSSEGQVRFWHAVIGMKTRGSIRCLELSSGGWSRSWWVSPSWLSAIPREESEWTTLCVIIWVGFSLSIA